VIDKPPERLIGKEIFIAGIVAVAVKPGGNMKIADNKNILTVKRIVY